MLMRLSGSEDKPLMPRGSKPGASWSAYLLVPIQQVIAWSGAMLAWGEFVTHGLKKRFRRQHALGERAELKASRRFAWPPFGRLRNAFSRHKARRRAIKSDICRSRSASASDHETAFTEPT